MSERPSTPSAVEAERTSLLELVESWLEKPMLLLGLVWLALLVVELVHGLGRLLELLGLAIWVIFVLEYALRFTLAPRKLAYLRQSWLTALSLLLPALRIFRVFQVARVLRLAGAARGVRLVRVVATVNRSMRSLGASMSRRGLGYMLGVTFVVLLAGAAGIYAFEGTPGGERPDLTSFGSALWWTAMLLTTMGSDYWPRSSEGRVLCLLLAMYAFAVFGYLTAALASYFVGRDAAHDEGEVVGQAAIRELEAQIVALREDVRTLLERSAPR